LFLLKHSPEFIRSGYRVSGSIGLNYEELIPNLADGLTTYYYLKALIKKKEI